VWPLYVPDPTLFEVSVTRPYNSQYPAFNLLKTVQCFLGLAMEDEFDDYRDVFSQDGVLLKEAPPAPYNVFINTIGTLYIWENIENGK